MQTKLGAVILAAGKGKRMGGVKPKVMFAFAGKPLIDHVLTTALGIDPEVIAIVTGFGREEVTNYISSQFSTEMSRVQFCIQHEQKGTGHAVQSAKEIVGDFEGDLLILNGDVPLISHATLTGLLETHRVSNASATVLTADYSNPTGYGRIVRKAEDGSLLKIVEHKDATEVEKAICEINSGTFLFDCRKLFSKINELNSSNAQGEFYLTDMIEIMNREGFPVFAHKAEKPEETYGINTPEQLNELSKLLNQH